MPDSLPTTPPSENPSENIRATLSYPRDGFRWLDWVGSPHGAVAFIALFAVLQTFYNASHPLFVDEAYYWEWSRHLALSYFDHPPMTAWLIALTTLPGTSVLTVRLVPVLCYSLAAWWAHRLARRMYGERTAAVALLIFMAMPAVQLGYLLATPDASQILFWALAIHSSYRVLFENGGVREYLATGLWIGASLLSRYTAVLFPAALLLFVVLRRPRLFLRWPIWAAMAVTVAAFSPVLIWNAEHHWIGFAFQYAHGTSGSYTLHLRAFFTFLGGLFGVFSPVFTGVLILALLDVFRRRADDKNLFVALFVLVPVLFFMWKGLFKEMQLNWVAMAFLAGSLLTADFVVRRKLVKTFWTGLALAVLMDAIVKFPLAFPIPPKWDLLHRLEGYRSASLALLHYRKPGDALYGDYLTTASILSFYAPGHPLPGVPTPSRPSQYTLWQEEGLTPSGPGLYLATAPKGKALARSCSSYRLLQTFHYRYRDGGGKTFYLYRCDARKAPTAASARP